MRPAIFLIATLVLSGSGFAQIDIEPNPPVWGQPFKVRISPIFPRDRLQRGDKVFVTLVTMHRGIGTSAWKEAVWDGENFVVEFSLPAGCEWAQLSVSTREKWINFTRQGAPVTPEGKDPPGAAILAVDFGTVKATSNWGSAVRTEFTPDSTMWWAYLRIWWRQLALGQIAPDQLLRQLEEFEKEEPGPELLRTLALGHWVAGNSDMAIKKLKQLCLGFPDSPYAVAAINDANYQTFRRDLDDLRERIHTIFAEMFNRVPTNPQLREELNAVSWLSRPSLLDLSAMRQMFDVWVKEDPTNMYPYFLVANALTETSSELDEAERLATRAIELSYADRPYDRRTYYRGFAYRLRSKIRSKRGNHVEALADIKMAQQYTLKYWPDDLDTEAQLWKNVGHLQQAEEVGLEAYRKGSLKAEGFVKELYELRHGNDEGFTDYFIARLTATDEPQTNDEAPLAPRFEAKTLDGRTVDSDSLRGEIVVMNFWFTTCGPCIGEMPELNKLVEDFKGKVRFLAFATDPPEPIKDFLKQHVFNYEIIPSAGQVAKDYGVEGFPSHFLIDPKGRLVWKGRGASPDNLERLRAMIQRVLSQ